MYWTVSAEIIIITGRLKSFTNSNSRLHNFFIPVLLTQSATKVKNKKEQQLKYKVEQSFSKSESMLIQSKDTYEGHTAQACFQHEKAQKITPMISTRSIFSFLFFAYVRKCTLSKTSNQLKQLL